MPSKPKKAQLPDNVMASLKQGLARIEKDIFQKHHAHGMTRADVRRDMILAAKIVAKAAKLGINPMELWVGKRK
jgi:hypothetical protein